VDFQSNWWSTFFDDVAAEMWVSAVPPDQTEREAALLMKLLDVPPGSEVLDVPCGAGRLSLALASAGYRITGVDLAAAFLDRARSADPRGSVDWNQRDMRDLPWRDRFDAAFCVGNSFGYLDDEGNAAFLSSVASALKPGAAFVLETPMIVESLMRSLKDRFWVKAGDVHLLVANRYDHVRGRLDIEYTFVAGGRTTVRTGTHRAYTYRQLLDLLDTAGFRAEPAAPWTIDSSKVTLIARKR